MGHLSRRRLILGVAVDGICLVANGGVLSLLQILTPLNAISIDQPGGFRDHS